jgi:acylphosphatase
MGLTALIRHTIHFEGHVQGVGFRYTTVAVARDHHVAGYVRNLPDGRVQLVAEGDPAELSRLRQAILAEMAGRVRRHTVDESPATGEFGQPRPAGIGIRY